MRPFGSAAMTHAKRWSLMRTHRTNCFHSSTKHAFIVTVLRRAFSATKLSRDEHDRCWTSVISVVHISVVKLIFLVVRTFNKLLYSLFFCIFIKIIEYDVAVLK